MRSFYRVSLAAAVIAVLVAGSIVPSDAARRGRYAGTRAFDGLWSVSIVTTSGDCNRAYRYPLRIWGGRVFKADTDPSYRVYGAVARSGAIGVTVSGNGQTASGRGRLAGNYGRGVWRTTNGQCSGRWTAERRG